MEASQKNIAVAEKADELIVAMAGNPNSGKTSIFNQLTGTRQHVGNWPGVTVEKKEGYLNYKDLSLKIVDLPGIYSLGAYSEDELIAKDFLLSKGTDLVINVVDATNLERNLYLTTQLLEMGVQLILVLNMYDEVSKKNFNIDIEKLSGFLGVPVVRTIATKGKGINNLVARAVEEFRKDMAINFKIDYGNDIEREIAEIKAILDSNPGINRDYNTRYLAVGILEQDEHIIKEIEKEITNYSINRIRKSLESIETETGEESDALIVEKKYAFIHGLVNDVLKFPLINRNEISFSDRIDKIVTNRFLGLPVFFLIMWTLFKITFTLSDPISLFIKGFFVYLTDFLETLLPNIGGVVFLNSLFIDGIIAGVGAVLVYLPNIFLLFLCISILEDSGYMSRAAYVMDKIMQNFGLHGKSFIPLILGFGCNVTGVMAARTLENRGDRVITILINSFMSCSARLPVYIVFAAVFFPGKEGNVIFSLYVLGIVIAIFMAKFFRSFLFKNETGTFVMELPPYRLPGIRTILIHMWQRARTFIKKAGTIIFAVVILIWALASLPVGVAYASQESMIGRIADFLSPVFSPLGLGNWQATASLIFGVLAKEVVVAALGVVYSVGDGGLNTVIMNNFTPLKACVMMILTLLYTPCIATLAAIKRETNSWKWMVFTAVYTFMLAWIIGFIIYQGGLLFGLK
ncbi:ferrous iron transport protein B [Halocella sp. SP3-1]|uniref:ferrous iron transport protein B n=1 Tax=Halocella sp. SP3-1 TaxID=2382161 RepID=UPI000F74E6DC|nr:ferrous iron transport protein B [Halocella sp. SP3-1]AZO95935.1 ferrous iron transport protein B [Halocella sp. SP3-1]